jgi:hypothetical protein
MNEPATEKQLEALKILERMYFEKFGSLPKSLENLSMGAVGKRIRHFRKVMNISDAPKVEKKSEPMSLDTFFATQVEKVNEQFDSLPMSFKEYLKSIGWDVWYTTPPISIEEFRARRGLKLTTVDSFTVTLTKDDIEQIALTMLNEFDIHMVVPGYPPMSYPRVSSSTPIAKFLMSELLNKMKRGESK